MRTQRSTERIRKARQGGAVGRGSVPAAVLGALCFCAPSARADWGEVALAFPIEGVAIDGDLADWPRGLPVYEFEYFINLLPEGPGGDLDASFRVAYDLDRRALLVAVVVVDDDHQFDSTSKKDLEEQDSYFLYFEPRHSADADGGSLAAGVGIGFDLERGSVTRTGYGMDVSEQVLQAAVRRVDSTTIYECSVVLGDALSSGKSYGLDHYVADVDANSPAELGLMWGLGTRKDGVAGRLGDVVLMDPSAFPGRLTGTVTWKDAAARQMPNLVRVTSLEWPDLWVHAAVDGLGRYSLELPAGPYRVAPAQRFARTDDADGELFGMAPGASVEVLVEGDQVSSAAPLVVERLSPPAAPPAPPGREGTFLSTFEPSQAAVLDGYVAELLDYYGVPGASLALVHGGKVAHQRTYGLRDTAEGAPVEKDTLFEAASVTKAVFAFAVMRLVERGQLDLDRPLHEYLPFPNIEADERSKQLTARLVLSHRSGLPNWGFGGPGGWKRGDPLTLDFVPGARFGYSGEGFNYLARVVEKITGAALSEFLQNEVVGPTGMQSAFFERSPELVKRMSAGHMFRSVNRDEPIGMISVASSLHTEAGDFARFMIALIERRGLSAESYAKLWTPQVEVPPERRMTADPSKHTVGLGFFLRDTPEGLVVEHGGNNGDFRCKFSVFPDSGAGFAFFTNGSFGQPVVRAVEAFLTGS